MTVPAAPAHVIRRQVLEVDLRGTEADGLALQRRLPDVCNSLVAPALERALERCDPGDGWVLVDRLDVDVGRLSLDDLERDLPVAVGRAVEAFLRHHAPAARTPSPPSPPGGGTPVGVRRRSERETADDALVFFLRTGRLPWSFRLPAGRSLEEVLLAAWTPAEGSVDVPVRRAAVLDAVAAPAARRRLVDQFSPAFRSTLLRLLDPATAATVATILASLAELDRSAPAGELLHARLWEAAFAGLSSGASTAPAELLVAAWRALPPDASGRPAVRTFLEGRWPGVAGRRAQGAASGASTDAADRPADAPSVVSGRPHPARPTAIAHRTPDEEIEDGVYVDDAGIVLLHPFLPRFFQALGIAVDDELVMPERALCLLHHLATGEVTAPEYDLVLPKVLCGVPIDEPVPAVTLTEAEVDEAAALLDAAIRHWEALRGTGRDALRGTFLLRPGMLSPDEDGGWLLRVEEQTFDILLDQLPWGISMIRLPWMRRMLRVEWR